MSSVVEPEHRSLSADPLPKSGPKTPRWLDSRWAWMGLACALIGLSGVVRIYQDWRIGIVKSAIEPCPFPLGEIPAKIGVWANIPDAETKLDKDTVRITGSTDHILRTYADELTGVKLSVLILYGPAEPVVPHTPEVCYPSGGYAQEPGGSQFTLPLAGHPARFRTATFSRTGGGQTERARVYYSFRLDGDWSPDIASGKKFHRINPGIFKVQIHRQMGLDERSTGNEPIEIFLGSLIPEIERLIAEESAHPTRTASR
jgi:hypothetical protein